MFPVVAFLCPHRTTDMLWEQPDSPGTGTESGDSSPSLLKAFFQSRGNDGTKADIILPLFWGRERTLQTKDTEIFSDSWASLLHEKPFVLHLDPGETQVPGLGDGKAVQNTPARSHRDSKRQSSDFLLLLSSPPKSPLGSVDGDRLNSVLDLACLAETELSQNTKCLAVANSEYSKKNTLVSV